MIKYLPHFLLVTFLVLIGFITGSVYSAFEVVELVQQNFACSPVAM